ncbi:efflux transporter outer membrane subunit [Rhodovibrio salinarum]|uniref:efflux transporter outer membrane subunit n=1 Tax=Rhodovibrio salinarum TaxID=1087 RepID=UPI0004BB8C5F|nr:efflux transporter outer membrane subunit [Rhodovibrio salinarum]
MARHPWRAHPGVATLAACLLIAGCTVGPDYERPESDMPEAWQSEILTGGDRTQELGAWWTRYDDPVLIRLVERAQRENLDIAAQAARVRQARAELGLQKAEQYPTVDAQADAARQRNSEEGTASGPAAGMTFNTFSLAASLNYELDLWGETERQEQAARARLFESAFTKDAVRLNVVTDVVTTYFNLRAAERQLAIARETARSREETLQLQESRQDAGDIASLPVQQARAELETTRAAIPPLREQIRRQRTALAILVGATPREIVNELDTQGPPLTEAQVPQGIPATLPSNLLERRPDVRAAEATLVAANADVGVAKSQWYPNVNLAGLLGVEALETSDLFQGSARTWSIGGSVLQPLVYFGRIQSNVDSAEAARDLAGVSYRQTLRTAFQEVDISLTALQASRERLTARQRQVSALQETLEVADRRYEGGFTSYIDVLDAQRGLFDAQLAMVEARRDELTAVATLYKALGGGWSNDRDIGATSRDTAGSNEPTSFIEGL